MKNKTTGLLPSSQSNELKKIAKKEEADARLHEKYQKLKEQEKDKKAKHKLKNEDYDRLFKLFYPNMTKLGEAEIKFLDEEDFSKFLISLETLRAHYLRSNENIKRSEKNLKIPICDYVINEYAVDSFLELPTDTPFNWLFLRKNIAYINAFNKLSKSNSTHHLSFGLNEWIDPNFFYVNSSKPEADVEYKDLQIFDNSKEDLDKIIKNLANPNFVDGTILFLKNGKAMPASINKYINYFNQSKIGTESDDHLKMKNNFGVVDRILIESALNGVSQNTNNVFEEIKLDAKLKALFKGMQESLENDGELLFDRVLSTLIIFYKTFVFKNIDLKYRNHVFENISSLIATLFNYSENLTKLTYSESHPPKLDIIIKEDLASYQNSKYCLDFIILAGKCPSIFLNIK